LLEIPYREENYYCWKPGKGYRPAVQNMSLEERIPRRKDFGSGRNQMVPGFGVKAEISRSWSDSGSNPDAAAPKEKRPGR